MFIVVLLGSWCRALTLTARRTRYSLPTSHIRCAERMRVLRSEDAARSSCWQVCHRIHWNGDCEHEEAFSGDGVGAGFVESGVRGGLGDQGTALSGRSGGELDRELSRHSGGSVRQDGSFRDVDTLFGLSGPFTENKLGGTAGGVLGYNWQREVSSTVWRATGAGLAESGRRRRYSQGIVRCRLLDCAGPCRTGCGFHAALSHRRSGIRHLKDSWAHGNSINFVPNPPSAKMPQRSDGPQVGHRAHALSN